MNIFLTILGVIGVLIVFSLVLFWGAYVGAKMVINKITFILFYQERMSFEEVNDYCGFFNILDILKEDYYEKRHSQSKKKETPDYWKVDTKKDMFA